MKKHVQIDTSPMKKLLGDYPETYATTHDRIKLYGALEAAFGPQYNYRPEVRQVIEHFDREYKQVHAMLRLKKELTRG